MEQLFSDPNSRSNSGTLIINLGSLRRMLLLSWLLVGMEDMLPKLTSAFNTELPGCMKSMVASSQGFRLPRMDLSCFSSLAVFSLAVRSSKPVVVSSVSESMSVIRTRRVRARRRFSACIMSAFPFMCLTCSTRFTSSRSRSSIVAISFRTNVCISEVT